LLCLKSGKEGQTTVESNKVRTFEFCWRQWCTERRSIKDMQTNGHWEKLRMKNTHTSPGLPHVSADNLTSRHPPSHRAGQSIGRLAGSSSLASWDSCQELYTHVVWSSPYFPCVFLHCNCISGSTYYTISLL